MWDVIVIGAGFAGITAGRTLQRTGRRVVVLEARDRIGGRAFTDRTSGEAVDLGGQWIGPGQTRINSLATEAGAATYPSWTTGRSTIVDSAGRARTLSPIPSIAVLGAGIAALPAVLELGRLAKRVDPARPWATRDAARLDALTVADWLAEKVRPIEARTWIDAAIRDVVSCELDQLSVLTLATEVAASGGIASVVGFDGGAQQDLFVDGAAGLVRHLASDLDVRLSSPVTEVRQQSDHVRVVASGVGYLARQVVLAVPPELAQEITHQPALPEPLARWMGNLRMGRVAKIMVLYDRPFWRDAGHSGTVLLPHGPATIAADVSQPGGLGRLCILACGRDADRLTALPTASRKEHVLAALQHSFGPPAQRPAHWIEKLWNEDPWTRGGYGAGPPPGVISRLSASPWVASGRVHWAGTETADQWPGYFEGAIQSGQRAATDVERELAREPAP